jgi:choline kinase
MKLVIIAAGEGSRARSVSSGKPKTLLPVKGKPLIRHLVENAVSVGIHDIVVVTGYHHDELEKYLEESIKTSAIETVYNPRWDLANGVSVLAAEAFIPLDDPFILSMSDHYYEAAFLEKVVQSDLGEDQSQVALDFKIDQIFDLEDAMKVTVDPENRTKITAMSKDLDQFDAVDCGVFKCHPDFFTALESARQLGRCSLSDACNLLIQNGKMGGIDIGESFWLDLDTPAAWNHLTQRG